MEWYGLDWPGSGYGQMEDNFESGDEPSSLIKFWAVL
jgi:hypothetical protein